jgi:hypothetical protein
MMNMGHSIATPALSIGTGKRPTGLTVLAIFNFIIAFFAGVMIALLYAAMKLVNNAAHDLGANGSVPGTGPLYATLALGGVAVLALVVAGVGYIKQAKFGWIAAHAYAVAGIVNTILALTVLNAHVSPVGLVLGFGYPAVTVALVNTVFRKNLSN